MKYPKTPKDLKADKGGRSTAQQRSVANWNKYGNTHPVREGAMKSKEYKKEMAKPKPVKATSVKAKTPVRKDQSRQWPTKSKQKRDF